MAEQMVLHEYSASGNCYKVRLTAALAGVTLDRREYDIMKGETRSPEFLANINANGRIPVLQVGDRFLPESNAACHFLADGTPLVPADRFDHADVLRWMLWEQYNHEPNIATVRFWMNWVGIDNLTEAQKAQLPVKQQGALAALALMNDHLAGRDWFVGEEVTLADICLFAYTDVAGEADFDLGSYPRVREWTERMRALPRFVAMNS